MISLMLCGCFYLLLYTTGALTNIFNSLPELNSSPLDLINIVLLILGFIFFNNRFEYAQINDPCSNLDSYELFKENQDKDSNLLLFADKGKGKEVPKNEPSDSDQENEPDDAPDSEITEESELSPKVDKGKGRAVDSIDSSDSDDDNQPDADQETEAAETPEINPEEEEAIDLHNAIQASLKPSTVDTEGDTALTSSSKRKRGVEESNSGVTEQPELDSFYKQGKNLFYKDQNGISHELDVNPEYGLRPNQEDIENLARSVGKHFSDLTERQLEALEIEHLNQALIYKKTQEILSEDLNKKYFECSDNLTDYSTTVETLEPDSKKLKLDTDSTTVESTATSSTTVEPTATSSTTVEPSVTSSTPLESTDTNLIPNSSQVNISSTDSNQASTSSTDLPTESESNSTGESSSIMSRLMDYIFTSDKDLDSKSPTSGSSSKKQDDAGDDDDFDGGDSGGGGD